MSNVTSMLTGLQNYSARFSVVTAHRTWGAQGDEVKVYPALPDYTTVNSLGLVAPVPVKIPAGFIVSTFKGDNNETFFRIANGSTYKPTGIAATNLLATEPNRFDPKLNKILVSADIAIKYESTNDYYGTLAIGDKLVPTPIGDFGKYIPKQTYTSEIFTMDGTPAATITLDNADCANLAPTNVQVIDITDPGTETQGTLTWDAVNGYWTVPVTVATAGDKVYAIYSYGHDADQVVGTLVDIDTRTASWAPKQAPGMGSFSSLTDVTWYEDDVTITTAMMTAEPPSVPLTYTVSREHANYLFTVSFSADGTNYTELTPYTQTYLAGENFQLDQANGDSVEISEYIAGASTNNVSKLKVYYPYISAGQYDLYPSRGDTGTSGILRILFEI